MKEYREKGSLVWVNPNTVWYGLEQVEWLLPQLELLREGLYPLEPSGGYVDIQQRISSHAPFEIVCQVAAEIDMRLNRTWPDNDLVEKKYCQGLTEWDIADKIHKDVYEVDRRIQSAVKYIASGNIPRWIDTEDRKGIDYREWVNQRRKQWFKRRNQSY